MTTLTVATAATIANNVLQSGNQNQLTADGTGYFNPGDDPTNILGGVRSQLFGMGFSVAQSNIVLAAVANSPSQPWTTPGMPAAKKLSLLAAFVGAMRTASLKKADIGDFTSAQDATKNLLLFIPSTGEGPKGPSGGDLNSYLGTQVT
jgi:hypothetical protein